MPHWLIFPGSGACSSARMESPDEQVFGIGRYRGVGSDQRFVPAPDGGGRFPAPRAVAEDITTAVRSGITIIGASSSPPSWPRPCSPRRPCVLHRVPGHTLGSPQRRRFGSRLRSRQHGLDRRPQPVLVGQAAVEFSQRLVVLRQRPLVSCQRYVADQCAGAADPIDCQSVAAFAPSRTTTTSSAARYEKPTRGEAAANSAAERGSDAPNIRRASAR